jgi:RNA polymerase sigma factor for flagellar operon FliA
MAAWTGYRTTADEDAVARRNALVLDHLPQVRLIARRIHDRVPAYISLEDLVSAGVIGLMAAIDNFDPTLNVQLNTYAEHRIRGAIMDSLREMDWAPRETRKRSKEIEKAIHTAEQQLGRAPGEEEIAELLKLTLTEYQSWLNEIQSIDLEPLEYAPSDGSSGDRLRFISNNEDQWPSTLLERSELERTLAQSIERMPKPERTVLSLYYYEELTLKEIGEVMGLHFSRIGQLRTQAVLRLRSHMQRVWPFTPGRRI